MKVSGSNNLSFANPANLAGQGKGTSSKEKSAFDSLMGRVHEDKPAAHRDEKPREQSSNSSNKQFTKSEPQKNQPAKLSSSSESKPVVAKSSAPKSSVNQNPAPRERDVKVDEREVVAADINSASIEDSTHTMNAADGGDVSAESLPSQSAFPTLSGPGMADRPLTAPVVPTVAAPGAKQKGATTEEDSANSLTRRVVWNDFLRKMSGLGVSVEDVMGAFARLSAKELAQPPEKSVESVVAALGLNDQQTLLARQYFGELVQKTQSKSLGEELNASSKQIGLTLMTQREMDRKALARSIDTMERSFFMQPTLEQQGKGITARDLRAETGDEKTADDKADLSRADIQKLGLSSGRTDALAQNFALGSQKIPTENSAAAQSLISQNPGGQEITDQDMNALVDKLQDSGPEGRRLADDLVKSMMARHATGSQAAAAGMSPMITSVQTSATAHAAHQAPRETMAALSALLNGGSDSSSEDSADQSTDAQLLAAAPTGRENLAAALGKSEFQGQLAQALAPAQATPVTVPELVQQAQVMVKEGGGEMKVTMHPEGLGEVALRVSVDGGRVQVQMITESDEAKRLIEHSIGELKSGLSQNHLTVDTIKVDTATNLGKQLEQQYQDAQRQNAHQNLEQFRQDHQGWRRSFFDTPNVKNYQSQNQAPTDVGSAGSTKSSSRRDANSRRLDLVA